MAGWFLARVLTDSPAWPAPWRPRTRRPLSQRAEPTRHRSRTGVGRQLVPARLLRRRDSTLVGPERRVPGRFDSQSWGSLRRGIPGRAGTGHGRGAEPARSRDTRVILLLTPPFDSSRWIRIHQGLRAGGARRRWSVHARRAVGVIAAARLGSATRPRALHLLNPINMRAHRRRHAYKVSRTWSRRRCTPTPRTRDVAVDLVPDRELDVSRRFGVILGSSVGERRWR